MINWFKILFGFGDKKETSTKEAESAPYKIEAPVTPVAETQPSDWPFPTKRDFDNASANNVAVNPATTETKNAGTESKPKKKRNFSKRKASNENPSPDVSPKPKENVGKAKSAPKDNASKNLAPTQNKTKKSKKK